MSYLGRGMPMSCLGRDTVAQGCWCARRSATSPPPLLAWEPVEQPPGSSKLHAASAPASSTAQKTLRKLGAHATPTRAAVATRAPGASHILRFRPPERDAGPQLSTAANPEPPEQASQLASPEREALPDQSS
eukprot:167128-Chlamydomonas_euryale.AAC.12